MTKRFLAIALAAAFVVAIVSCGPSDSELLAVQQAEDATLARDSMENEMVETMDEINRNLDQIREKQGLIALDRNTENISKKEEILKNIGLINDLIESNRKKIEELTILSRKLGKEKNAMARIADQTRERIRKQEEEIAELKARLQEESFKVEDLNRRIEEIQSDNEALQTEARRLDENNAQLTRDLNKVYFTYGTEAQLEQKGLIEKKGGILGLGAKEQLVQAFTKNKAIFTELDLREAKRIPIDGRKPRLLTTHPEGSYEWIAGEGQSEYSQLVIKDPDDFWSTSRFLIIAVR